MLTLIFVYHRRFQSILKKEFMEKSIAVYFVLFLMVSGQVLGTVEGEPPPPSSVFSRHASPLKKDSKDSHGYVIIYPDTPKGSISEDSAGDKYGNSPHYTAISTGLWLATLAALTGGIYLLVEHSKIPKEAACLSNFDLKCCAKNSSNGTYQSCIATDKDPAHCDAHNQTIICVNSDGIQEESYETEQQNASVMRIGGTFALIGGTVIGIVATLTTRLACKHRSMKIHV